MRNKTTIQLALGVLGSIWFSVATADVLVAGPLERVSRDGKEFTVLGQSFAIDSATKVEVNGKSQKSVVVRALKSGTYVAVASEAKSSVNRAGLVLVGSGQYVPGASVVYVAGVIEQSQPAYGTIRIGSLVVDVTSASLEVQTAIKAGTFVEVLGTQPLPGGRLIGESFVAYPGRSSIGGTGVRSIGGTGIQSIGGTGIQSIGGTGFFSIGGTGIESIGGTGIESIGGTGIESIGGTGIESIGGTGIESIGGTGIESIGGTGTESIGGTGVKSIGGTGVKSIGGTGVKSIGGTGVKSIGGTGVQSIGGTGVKSIGGTGVRSIGGTGVRSIGGTGAQ